MASRDFHPKFQELKRNGTSLETDEDTDCSGDESSSSHKVQWGFVALGAVIAVVILVATRQVSAHHPRDVAAGFLAAPSNSSYQSISDSDEDLALEYYEQAAVTISSDWRPQMAGVKAKDEKNVPKNRRMTLYHQTSPAACNGIMSSNFRLGKGGWCGKGIYFAMSPEETRQKAVTPDSGHGCMLEVEVDVGRIQRFRSCGRYNKMTLQRLRSFGYDSILFEPPEKTGDEVIIFEPKRILNKKIVPFNSSWMAKRWYGKPR